MYSKLPFKVLPYDEINLFFNLLVENGTLTGVEKDIFRYDRLVVS